MINQDFILTIAEIAMERADMPFYADWYELDDKEVNYLLTAEVIEPTGNYYKEYTDVSDSETFIGYHFEFKLTPKASIICKQYAKDLYTKACAMMNLAEQIEVIF